MESDSTGVAIVMNHEPDGSFHVVVDPEPRNRVSGNEQPALISKIVGVGRLSDGRIALMDGDPVQIRVHGRSGDLQHPFSRQGQGPFEFRAPVHFAVLPGDTLVGWDAMFGSAYGFLPNGSKVLERHTDLGRVHQALGPYGFAEDGTPLPGVGHYLVKVGVERAADDAQYRQSPGWQKVLKRVQYLLVTDDYRTTELGTYDHSLTAFQFGGTGWVAPMYFYLSHSTQAVDHRRFYLSDALEYRIDVWEADGQLVRSIRRPRAQQQLEESAFRAAYARWRAQYKAMSEAEFARPIALLPPPRQLPPILGLMTDSRDWLWVRDGLDRWSVFDSAGKWLTTVQVPLRRVYEFGGDYVLGLVLDSDDVPSVVELPLKVERRKVAQSIDP